MNFRGNNAFSSYSAFYVALKSNRLARTGLTMTTSYTWSHAIDNLSSTGSESANDLNLGLTDPLNPGLDRGYADFDIRQRVVLSGIWESHFFRESSHRVWKQVLAGWSLAPIFAARSGAPFTIFDCSNAFEVCQRYIPGAPVSPDAQKPTPTNQSNLSVT